MNLSTIALLLCSLAALVGVAMLALRWTKWSQRLPQKQLVDGSGATSLVEVTQDDAASMAEAVHFGTDIANPAVTLRPLPLSELETVDSTPVVQPSLGVASRIAALMQAAPSVLVAGAHTGRQLMEVVVNGQLVRASDGDGFRAMAMGSKGVKEHARLYETKDLTNLVSAAAVWQLASVVVAQKHMADISQKLSELKDDVSHISEFLDSGRRSIIRGTYQYLQQAYEALAQGELSQAIRGELESCERELLAVQDHLVADCRRRAALTPRDDDTFGTESLHRNCVAKYRELSQTVSDLKLCLRARALSWYVLSLYPGEQALKGARRDSIQQGLDDLDEVQSLVRSQSRSDVESIKSMWTTNGKLNARKGDVLGEAREVQLKLESVRVDTSSQLDATQLLLLARDVPTQLIVELFDGAVKQVRQRELMAV